MRYYVIMVLLLAVSLPMGYWLLGGGETAPVEVSPKDTNSTEVVPRPVKASAPEPQQAERDPETNSAMQDKEEYRRLKALGLTEEQIAERERVRELEQAANRRFESAVSADELRADQVRPAIKKLFKTMTLEPVFDPDSDLEGYVDGMRIAELTRPSPLAKAGFRKGDRLVSFDGYPLRDPAEIASLFTQLEEQFEVCARRSADRLCRIISLEDS